MPQEKDGPEFMSNDTSGSGPQEQLKIPKIRLRIGREKKQTELEQFQDDAPDGQQNDDVVSVPQEKDGPKFMSNDISFSFAYDALSGDDELFGFGDETKDFDLGNLLEAPDEDDDALEEALVKGGEALCTIIEAYPSILGKMNFKHPKLIAATVEIMVEFFEKVRDKSVNSKEDMELLEKGFKDLKFLKILPSGMDTLMDEARTDWVQKRKQQITFETEQLKSRMNMLAEEYKDIDDRKTR